LSLRLDPTIMTAPAMQGYGPTAAGQISTRNSHPVVKKPARISNPNFWESKIGSKLPLVFSQMAKPSRS
jgi:hypothetical protein